MKDKKSLSFIVIALLSTWILTIVFYKNNTLMMRIQYLMYTPGIVALLIRILTEGFTSNIYRNPKAKGLKSFLKAVLFAVLYVIGFVSVSAIIGAIIYGQKIDSVFFAHLFNLQKIGRGILVASTIGILGALGEEYGWRAFLLPELNKKYSKVKSTVIVGVVWALFHMPVVYILASELKTGNPIIVMLVQGTAAFTACFAFSYCYFISNRVYPTVIMHGFWNMFNPYVLGSIYLGMPGLVLTKGKVFITNGEGIMGIVIGLILLPIFIYLMNRMRDNKKTI